MRRVRARGRTASHEKHKTYADLGAPCPPRPCGASFGRHRRRITSNSETGRSPTSAVGAQLSRKRSNENHDLSVTSKGGRTQGLIGLFPAGRLHRPGPPAPFTTGSSRAVAPPIPEEAPVTEHTAPSRCTMRFRYSVLDRPRNAKAKNTTANARTMASSTAIDRVWPNTVTLVGNRARAAADMFCAAKTTWRNGAMA